MNHGRRVGFTLVELLVVIAMIGVLVSMLMPAIGATREAARRTACRGNLGQLAMAVADYESSYTYLPAGVVDQAGPIQNTETGHHHSWTIALLPFLDLNAVGRHVDPDQSVYAPTHASLRRMIPSVFVCLSADVDRERSCYAGIHHNVEQPIDVDNHGLLFLNSRIRGPDILDGRAFTLLVGEKNTATADFDPGWMSGTRATLRNTGTLLNATPPWLAQVTPAPATTTDTTSGSEQAARSNPAGQLDASPGDQRQQLFVGGLGSHHPGITGVCFADGHTRFMADSLDATVLRQLGHRADGELIDPVEVE
jgi:prepilin-type N-terminal cleavage/methylation domain-containing protein